MREIPFKTSFWFDDQIDTAPPLTGNILTDVVIIGGGFAGLSSAYHLWKQNAETRITLIESKHIGFGASGRAAGWVMNLPPAMWMLDDLNNQQVLDNVRFTIGMAEANNREIGQLVADESIDCDWTEVAHTLAARNAIEVATIKWAAPQFTRVGLEAEIHDAQITSKLVGYPAKSSMTFFAHTVQPYRLARGLRDWLIKHDVTIHENTHVKAIQSTREGVQVVTDQGYSVSAHYGILATNAYTKELKLPIERPAGRVNHTYILATQPLDANLLEQISTRQLPFGDPTFGYFIGRIYKERLIFNGVDRESANTLADDHHRPSYDRVYSEMLRRFPFLKDVRLDAAWGGAVQETRTEAPIVQKAPQHPTLILNVGYGGGSGIGMALLSGRITTALVLEGGHHDADAYRLQELYKNSRFPLMGLPRAGIGVLKSLLFG